MNVQDYSDWVRRFNSLVDAYDGESDRAAALLAGSFVETFLGSILEDLFVRDDKHMRAIFKGHGPLSSFSARAELLYAMGFLTDVMWNDLKFIRKIRNHFAHHPDVTGFHESPRGPLPAAQ